MVLLFGLPSRFSLSLLLFSVLSSSPDTEVDRIKNPSFFELHNKQPTLTESHALWPPPKTISPFLAGIVDPILNSLPWLKKRKTGFLPTGRDSIHFRRPASYLASARLFGPSFFCFSSIGRFIPCKILHTGNSSRQGRPGIAEQVVI